MANILKQNYRQLLLQNPVQIRKRVLVSRSIPGKIPAAAAYLIDT